MTGTQLDEVGNTEMLNWAVMFGAIGAMEGELIDYIPTWHHGLCMMRFLPQRARTKERMQAAERVRRLQVREPGVPVLQASALRSLRVEQADVRVAPQRGSAHRIINDFEAVADEYGLKGKQREAAKEMINVGQGGKVSDHVGPLAEAGAHPLQALMALHVIFSTSHARGQAAMAAGQQTLKRSTRQRLTVNVSNFGSWAVHFGT